MYNAMTVKEEHEEGDWHFWALAAIWEVFGFELEEPSVENVKESVKREMKVTRINNNEAAVVINASFFFCSRNKDLDI